MSSAFGTTAWPTRAPAEQGALGRDLAIDDTAAVIHSVGHPDVHEFLVLEQGWDVECWTGWIGSTLEAALLAR